MSFITLAVKLVEDTPWIVITIFTKTFCNASSYGKAVKSMLEDEYRLIIGILRCRPAPERPLSLRDESQLLL